VDKVDLVTFSTREFVAFILILFRVSGIVIFAPVLGSVIIPAQVKVALSVLLALVLLPVVHPAVPAVLTLGYFVAAAASESVVGMIIGFAAGLIFVGVQLGGMQIGQQMGTEIGSIFNPFLETQTSLMSEVFFIFTIFIYLGIGGHRIMLTALVDSFKTVPIGAMVLSPRNLDMLISLFGYLFVIAFAISAPVVLVLFLVTVAMGFVARTVPQMNILIVGFPVRIIVGLAVMIVTLPAVGYFIARAIGAVMQGLSALVAQGH